MRYLFTYIEFTLIKAMYEHWESRPTREGAEVRPQ